METRKSKYRSYRAQIESMLDEEFPKAKSQKEEKLTPFSTLEADVSASLLPSKKGLYDKYVSRNRKKFLAKLIVFALLVSAMLAWYFIRIR